MAFDPSGAFSWKDPKTGKTYRGVEGRARWVAFTQGKPYVAAPGKGLPPGSAPLPPPPVGTYDPSIDYNASASDRGYTQLANDASTQFEQGTEDYGSNLAGLTTNRDRTLADLLTQRGDTQHQYGILGNQQAERAAQAGIMSQGLLGKSNAVRAGNLAHDLAPIDLATTRTGEDYATNTGLLKRGFDRIFAGFQPGSLPGAPGANEPPVGAGSLLTGLWRGYGENKAFQNLSAGQRTSQAAANNYQPPGSIPMNPDDRQKQYSGLTGGFAAARVRRAAERKKGLIS